MKTLVNQRYDTSLVRSPAFLAAITLLLLAHVASSLASPPVVTTKKDGEEWRMSWWLGGWQGTGGPERLYFWMEFNPWTMVFKPASNGSYWIHDSKSKGTVVIASAGVGEDANTEPHDIRYIGVGSMVDTGLWKVNENNPSVMNPTEKMTWTIKATVLDVVTGDEWDLYWHFVMRDGEWTERYSFEPAR